MMRFPGTVSRPAETMVKQIDFISSNINVSSYPSQRLKWTYSRSASPLDPSKYFQ
jgi:hypothetical protein